MATTSSLTGRTTCLAAATHERGFKPSFGRSGDEIEVNLGSLDAPDQLVPTYELWTVRREAWLPPFPLKRHYERDRDATSRFED